MVKESHRIEKDKLGIKISSCYSAFTCKKRKRQYVESVLPNHVDDFGTTARTESGLNGIRRRLNEAVEVGTSNEWPDIMDMNRTEVFQTTMSIVAS